MLGYSLCNQVLLIQQAEQRRLSLRIVATYDEFKVLGRPVRLGQTGLRIRAYKGMTAASASGEPGRQRFGMTSVFSIDQTVEDGADEQTVAIRPSPPRTVCAAIPPASPPPPTSPPPSGCAPTRPPR